MSEAQRQFELRRIEELERRADLWQRQYRLLLESLPEAVFTQDEGGNLVSTNAAGERLSGYARKELLHLKIRDLLADDFADRSERLVRQADTANPQFTLPAELIVRDGSRRPVIVNATVLREGRHPVLAQYLVRDAAQEKRHEESSHAETRFRLMAKNLSEMVLAYDMDRRLTFANAAAETLTGYSLAELERRQFICWIHPEDRQRMLERWEQLFQARSFYEAEYRLVTKDGRMKWVAASWGPILDDSGKQVGVQGRERDITERRMAVETLRQSEQSLRINEARYRTLFEDSPFPMWEEDFSRVKAYLDALADLGVRDLRQYLMSQREALVECVRRVRILDVNRAAREFYGAATKEELLRDLTEIFDDTAYDLFADELATLAEGRAFQSEFHARTLTGEPRTVSIIVSLVPTPNRDWSRVIVSFFDVTDRKRLEEQVLQSQKLESLGRLAGGIAHDFNNLLTIINGYADLLLRGLEPGSPLRRGLGEIQNAGARGAELTQQLLAFSRKQVVQMRPLDLNEVVQESEGMLHRVIGEDVRLEIALDPDIWTLKGDRGQMHQVLLNLVVNGREAMPHGGSLTIETRNVFLDTDMRETSPAPPARPFVVLRIGDTGIGMDTRTKQHLFEPFFTTKHVSKGTGLGLATVFGIVTQSGGHISVVSEPGLGAVFSVYLPAFSGPLRPDSMPARRDLALGTGAVLVAEDQSEVRSLTAMILRRLGFEVLEAADGPEALALARGRELPIRLLLTDVIMPGMNGRELAAQMQALQPSIKVMYMSGYTDRVMHGDGLLETAAFLQKPFTPEQLTDMLQRVLSDTSL